MSEATNIKNGNFYNDKELFEDGDLDWYDYGYRNYDAQIGRFTQLDPLTDEYPEMGGYQYADDEPIVNVDMDGLGPEGMVATKAVEKSAGVIVRPLQQVTDLSFKAFTTVGMVTERVGMAVVSNVVGQVGSNVGKNIINSAFENGFPEAAEGASSMAGLLAVPVGVVTFAIYLGHEHEKDKVVPLPAHYFQTLGDIQTLPHVKFRPPTQSPPTHDDDEKRIALSLSLELKRFAEQTHALWYEHWGEHKPTVTTVTAYKMAIVALGSNPDTKFVFNLSDGRGGFITDKDNIERNRDYSVILGELKQILLPFPHRTKIL